MGAMFQRRNRDLRKDAFERPTDMPSMEGSAVQGKPLTEPLLGSSSAAAASDYVSVNLSAGATGK